MAAVQNHHSALIYTMVLMAAADRDMSDAEMSSIGDMIGHLPVFRDFDRAQIAKTAAACVDILNGKEGLDAVLKKIVDTNNLSFRSGKSQDLRYNGVK